MKEKTPNLLPIPPSLWLFPMIFLFLLLCLPLPLSAQSISGGAILSESSWVEHLTETNPEIKALARILDAQELQLDSSERIWSPALLGEISHLRDEKQLRNSQFVYDRLDSTSYKMGVQKQFEVGLESRLYFQTSRAQVVNGSFGGAPFNSTSWESGPTIEFKMPLWSGGFGRKIRANYRSIRSQRELSLVEAEFNFDKKINEAKILFWSAVIENENLKIQKESHGRVQKIYGFIKKKAERNLEQKSNLIQARTVLELTDLELALRQQKLDAALDKLRLLSPSFDESRLPRYPLERFGPISFDKSTGMRSAPELLVQYGYQVQISQTEAELEDAKSTFDLVASHGFNAVESNFNSTLSSLKKMNHPSTLLAINWLVPLDFGVRGRSITAKNLIIQETQNRIEHETNLGKTQYAQLVDQFEKIKKLFLLSQKIESTQAERLATENQLLAQGRSSIYQLLQFELDYSQAQTRKYQYAAELEYLKNQIELYKYK